MASGPFASSTDFAVSSGAGTAPPEGEPRAGTGGVVVIPWGARPLCAERSPWMACSARKTASLQGVVTALAGLDLGISRDVEGEGGSGEFAGKRGTWFRRRRGSAQEEGGMRGFNPFRTTVPFWQKPFKFQVVCPQNGAAVLKGVKREMVAKKTKK